MSAIDDIRTQVVQHLMERHYQAKERGEDFFFTVKITDPDEVPYFLQPRVTAKATLKVSFYGEQRGKQIAYLIVADNQQVFLVIDLDAQGRYDELGDAADELRQYAFNRLKYEVRGIHGQSATGKIEFIAELIKGEDLIGKIRHFLDEVKPEIDDCFESIRSHPQFNYLFLTGDKFEQYRQAEPAYIVAPVIQRTNLRLTSIRVTNFRGISSMALSGLSPSARWIVLTGENGYGKTSVLQAIAAGLYGNYDESGQVLVPETAFIGVSYQANGDVVETNSRSPRHESVEKKLTRELATYGSSRLQVSAGVTRDMVDKQLPTTYHLFNTDGRLLNVEQLLKDSYEPNRPFFDQLVTLFQELIPQLAAIDVKTVNLLPEVLYIEKDEQGKSLTSGLPFGQLAAGFRNIIAMFGDLVYRLSVKQRVEKLSDLQGIILIDELELHLHPTYQKRLPEVLTRVFPNLQFIVSTHSPIPLLGIPADAGVVLLHVRRAEETGIVVEQLDVDFAVLTPNAILSSPIFGFHDIIPDSKPDDRMVRSEDTYAAVQQDSERRQVINEFLTPERQQELLNLIKAD